MDAPSSPRTCTPRSPITCGWSANRIRDRVRGIGATVADTLAAAHSCGVIHAAVCPATILMVDDGVRLGGFGATAPGLARPLGLWAFTAPEHRASAADGASVGSPAGDVFALAATICVALSGVLPWSDPMTWADEAGLPDGPDAPRWVLAIRDALVADPAQRPRAEEFAAALRSPDEPVRAEFHGQKVDLRSFIPRQVRRLAAYSIDAMADGVAPALGRATPNHGSTGRTGTYRSNPVPAKKPLAARLGGVVRAHRTAAGVIATILAILIATGVYAWTGRSSPSAAANTVPVPNPAASASAAAIQTLTLLSGARQTGEEFLHGLGIRDATTCALVHGTRIVTTAHSTKPITCTDLFAHATTLIGTKALVAMRRVVVSQAVSFAGGAFPGSAGSGDPDPHAFISLAYVPGLASTLRQFEMILTYHDDQWWIVQVTFG